MTYRDDRAAALEHLHRVRSQVAILRARPVSPEARALARQRRALTRARRKLARLRHPIVRFLPSSIGEVVVSTAFALAILLLATVIGSYGAIVVTLLSL